jgi:DNA polymerase III epsilon subunit family exonuclease
MCWNLDPDLNKALNFPDVMMDELTKIQINNIATENNVTLMKLFRNIGSYDVGPLTKKRIEQFVSLLDRLSELLKEGSAIKVVRGLIDTLDSERNPYHSDDLSAIENPPSFGDIQKAVNALYDKIQQKHPITIIAHYGIDNYCSAGIINYVLTSYFGMEVTCQFLSPDGDIIPSLEEGEWERDISKNILYLIIGEKGIVPPSITKQSILIGALGQWNNIADSPYVATIPSGEGGVVSTVALKLCQRLMSSYEAGTIEGLIAYDLETIGNQPKTAEIIEIAAKKMGARRKSENAFFHELVKPKKTIPKSSTDVHGITNDDVKDKPSIEQILPKFIEFVSNSILVGHNIVDFDNKVISRYMASYMGKPELPNRAYDTLVVAKRLFPLENYKLDALADKFGIPYEISELHRANTDVSLTENLFRSLRREELSRNERKSLKEVLPLVALGILDKNSAMEKENSAFYNAALRYVKCMKGRSEVIELLPISHLEASEEEEAIRFLENMADEEPPITKDDEVWNSIIARVQNSVINFERDAYDKSLTSFLSHSALLTGSDVSEEVEDKVTMMTVHSAKGTEFPVVIMIGMEQGNFPIISRDQSEAEMEEERRLCYVGMTRAKKRLYMTSVRFRNSDREATPSQFIWEIQPGLMKTVTAKEVRSAWDKRKNIAVSK